MHQKTFLALILTISLNLFSSEVILEIDVSEQRLYVILDNSVISSYPISSSEYGEGSIVNSFKTPLGNHVIKEMIGEGAKINTIFKSRINTSRQADIIKDLADLEDDYVTSRIMWLDGADLGINKGKGIDSFSRYIYIHGTHEEGLIGLKASHGCIRMFNSDVIELYSVVKKGTKVLIKT
tara:strand:- start:8915 stop:9454 length:540 start_codon:yes stop_codon:yes gene_type:complete